MTMMFSADLVVADRRFTLHIDRHIQMLYYTGPDYSERTWGRGFRELENGTRIKFGLGQSRNDYQSADTK